MKLHTTTETTEKLIDLIETKTPNVYLRFGDGDFNLMSGQHDMLAHASCEIQLAFGETWKRLTADNMIAVNYHCPELNMLENGMYPGVHEYPLWLTNQCIDHVKKYIPTITNLYSQVALHQVMSTNMPLYKRFLQTVKTNGNTILLCNEAFASDRLATYFGPHIKIGAPGRDSFNHRERIGKEFSVALDQMQGYIVCIFALRCGGRAMTHMFIDTISALDKKVLLLDIGSSIDCLMGQNNTRAWVELTRPDISTLQTL